MHLWAAEGHGGSSWEGGQPERAQHHQPPGRAPFFPRDLQVGTGLCSPHGGRGGGRLRGGDLSSQRGKGDGGGHAVQTQLVSQAGPLPRGGRVGTGGPPGLCLVSPGSSAPSATSNTAHYTESGRDPLNVDGRDQSSLRQPTFAGIMGVGVSISFPSVSVSSLWSQPNYKN